MKKSILVVAFTTAVPLLLLSAEPSAFGAGDLNNPEPYGLTSNEKVILETKQKLHTIAVKSNNQANEVDSLRERLDGLQSIIESLSRKSHNNKINLQKLEEENSLKNQNTNEYEKRLSDVVEKNTQAIEKTKTIVSEMTKLVDQMNKDYVTKAEFNSLVKDVNKFKELMAKELKHATPSKSTSKKSSADLYDEAKKMYAKKYYTKAIENYETLIKRNYKPAYAHYMIGEMNYRRKNYANALSYFKKSTALYSKASYMPTLMLHSAISMEKTGDKKHAKAFYKAVVSKYPNSQEAKEAKKYL
jgi:TolA-binding protein